MTAPKTVLVLCTGNSCRSQMAEALVNARLGHTWQAFSAGTQPASEVHPLAVKALAEIGIGVAAGAVPKHLSVFVGQPFDLVVTVCDDAAENCPLWPGQGRREHVPFRDPVLAIGSEEERLDVYRQVRDEIAERLLALLIK